MTGTNSIKGKRHSLAKSLTSLAIVVFFGLGGFSPSSYADDHRGGDQHRGGEDHRREDHRGHRGYAGGYYAPPPVVYGPDYGYAPPPVVYGPGVGINLPGVSIGIN